MNGVGVTVLLWVAGVLIALLSAVVGFAGKLHVSSDREFRERTDEEINKLRTRLHGCENRIAEACTRLRWINEDSKK
jgi:hypothetical protein